MGSAKNDAPLALASADTTHLLIGACCRQGALGLQSTRVRSTKRDRERLVSRNVGDWEKEEAHVSRRPGPRLGFSLVRDPVGSQRCARHIWSAASLDPGLRVAQPLALSHTPSLLPPETRKIWWTYRPPIFRSHAQHSAKRKVDSDGWGWGSKEVR